MMKKKTTFFICLTLVMGTSLLVAKSTHANKQEVNTPIVQQRGNEITIDANNPIYQQKIPADSTTLPEKKLNTNPLYEHYVQQNIYIPGFFREQFIGKSTTQDDEIIQAFKLSNNKVLSVHHSTDFPYAVVTPGYFYKDYNRLVLSDSKGTIEKEVPLYQGKTAYYMSSSDNQNDTYTFIYTNGLVNGDVIIYETVDKDLNILSRQTVTQPAGVIYNRMSIDFNAEKYHLPLLTNVATQKTFFIAKNIGGTLNTAGLAFPSVNFASYTPNGQIPAGTMVGIANGAFTNTSSNGFIAPLQLGYASGAKGFGTVLVEWDQNNKIVFEKLVGDGDGSFQYQSGISSPDKYYFTITDKSNKNSNTKLYLYDLNQHQLNLVAEYPPKTTLTLTKNGASSVSVYGYIVENNQPAIFIGFANNLTFELTGMRKIASDVPITIRTMLSFDETIFLGGMIEGKGFVDSVYGPTGNWTNKAAPQLKYNAFLGSALVIDNYAPAILAPQNVILDLEDTDLKQEINTGSQNILNNWLITGTKTGSLSDPLAIKVTDYYDLSSKNISGQKSQDWLNKRINRNPLDPTRAIDWSALGLDLTSRGPQKIKYFVSDENKQISATSRIINKMDNETIWNEKGALAASNFTIHVNDVEALTDNSSKTSAQLQAWDINSGELKSADVLVKQDELTAIQDVKKAYDQLTENNHPADLIKPYPLTYEFTYDGKTLTKTITVFIIDDTTTVDQTNNIVLYAFDFTEYLHHVKELSSNKVVQLSTASAWNLTMNWGDTALPANKLTANVTEVPVGLNHVTKKGLYPVTIKHDQLVQTKVKANILDSEATIHVRQVILDSNNNLVLPLTGYFQLNNENGNPSTSHSKQEQILATSTNDDTLQVFSKQVSYMNFDHWWYEINPIIPQYYEYAGYILTDSKITHQASDRIDNQQEKPLLDFTVKDTYWVTIYLKASTNHPKSYSSNYSQNSFGKLP
ncbi:hypothetical protein [Isobaculum melis]|uniref:MucBP domain-containing protein n=1 Tax=Isobaculum melis TaxID=142588 RepID=A0A1H9R8X1_9LACT|nr:hypothetical protein [Isobaculum melis]SER69118.1 hypothetical protein SAMN04488559_103131 [Isobaculum melis]